MKRADLFVNDMPWHTFSPDEMAQCHTQGDCVQCGLCCVAFPVDELPITIPTEPDEPVRLRNKPALEPCRHLERTPDGRLGCACHAAKDHPSLKECITFSGNTPRRDEPGQTGYDAAVGNLLEGAIFFDDPEVVLTAEILLRRGVVMMRFAPLFEVNLSGLVDFLRLALTLPMLPVRLLEALEIKESLALLSAEGLAKLTEALGLTGAGLSSTQQQFFADYMPSSRRADYHEGINEAAAVVAK